MNAALFQREGLAGKGACAWAPAIEKMPVRDENAFHETIANFPETHYHKAESIFKTSSVKISTITHQSQRAYFKVRMLRD